MLRTKTRQRLTKEQEKKVENMLENLLESGPEAIRTFVWDLTYRPERIRIFGIEGMSKEAIKAVRGDIIGSYRKEYPEWDYAKKYNRNEYVNITASLRKAAKGDEVIVHEVMERIEDFVVQNSDKEISRVIYLLMAKQDNYSFGGLKALGFNSDEALLLHPIVNAIGEMVQEVSKYIPHVEEESSYKEEEPISEEIPEELKEKEKMQNENVHEEKDILSHRVMYLMENQSVICKIYKAADFLKQVKEEHDIEWILQNRKTIEEFFSTLNNLQ